ncbi:MAG: hypothetical protein DRN15_03830 [Thermoprotei archaeon]|nr:MAG: hypothetical protein DRM97_05565 [Thermoprotei archaeon]RLF24255.1 MAG: hypothetical protein DRN15_03830 [Thermoprotei archaeon]
MNSALSEEFIYKMLFLILFIPGTLIRGLYVHRARSHVEKRPLKERLRLLLETEGYLGTLLLLGQGAVVLAGLVIYLFLLPSFAWLQLWLPHEIRWLGFIIGIPGLILLAWAHHTLDKYWSITIEFREEHKLVTSGPYRWIRHPIYTAHLIYFMSWMLVTANILFLVNYLLTAAIIVRRMPREERALIERFGQEYISYMRRTGRLIPRIRIWRRE